MSYSTGSACELGSRSWAAWLHRVNITHRTTDSLFVTKRLIEAGVLYGVLPLSAIGREVADARIRFAPVTEPALTQSIGVGATAQLDLPRELMVRLGNTIREEAATQITSGRWRATLLASEPWNPRA